jgi:hypothetical protein
MRAETGQRYPSYVLRVQGLKGVPSRKGVILRDFSFGRSGAAAQLPAFLRTGSMPDGSQARNDALLEVCQATYCGRVSSGWAAFSKNSF